MDNDWKISKHDINNDEVQSEVITMINGNGVPVDLKPIGKCDSCAAGNGKVAYWRCLNSHPLQAGCGKKLCDIHCNFVTTNTLMQMGIVQNQTEMSESIEKCLSVAEKKEFLVQIDQLQNEYIHYWCCTSKECTDQLESVVVSYQKKRQSNIVKVIVAAVLLVILIVICWQGLLDLLIY